MADAAIEWLKLLGGLISVAGAAAGAAIFVVRAQYQVKQERLEAKLADTERDRDALEGRYRTLLDSGTAVLNIQSAIDKELALMADRVAATAGSVFVPSPSYIANEKPSELVFLSVLAGAGASLAHERIPIAGSGAGTAFSAGAPMLDAGVGGGAVSALTDRATNFHTRNKVSVPLFHRRDCVGVVQFLNKRNGEDFTSGDVDTLVRFRDLLGARVGELIADPENLRKLGITPREPPLEATVLFADISNSSQLARSIDTAHVVDMFNQYFEELCDVVLRENGTVDQFLGDGFMASFNAKRPAGDHEERAVRAAALMQQRFERLKSRWVAMNYGDVQAISNRIGISAGPVKRAEMGHSQLRQITIFGIPVNVASHLCQRADRSRSVIVIDDRVRRALPAGAKARALGPVDGVSAHELDPSTFPASM